MSRRMLRGIACLVVAVLVVPPAAGQDDASTASRSTAGEVSSRAYVPAFAVASLRMNVAKLLASPSVELLPTEIAQAWCLQNLGMNLSAFAKINLVVGAPMGPGPPPVGAVIRLTEDFDPGKLNTDLFGEIKTEQVGGHEVFVLGGGNETVYLHAVDARTVLVGLPGMLPLMIDANEGEGVLADLIEANPLGNSPIQLIAAMEPVRPMLVGAANAFGGGLPGPTQELVRVPELLDALIIDGNLDLADPLSITMLAADEETATELLGILTRSIAFGKEIVIAQSETQISGEGRVADAQRAYSRRYTKSIADMFIPKQKGDRLVIDGLKGGGVATTGVMVGLLLPAVQAAREASRRMSASNNIKQIGLSLHNYHAAYRHLPRPVSVDEEGNPLLSWRVAILPFIEQQALYEKFHLDEPWDSPHNIQFSTLDIPTFQDPSLMLPPGYTVFRAMVGKGLAFSPEGESKFRDFTDGLSNTIMLVEADASEATPWSAPAIMEVDMDNPIPQMGHIHQGGFHVMMADGAILFITHTIDSDLLRALFTRGGGENIENVRP